MPSENLSPSLSVYVHVLPSSLDLPVSVARSGTTFVSPLSVIFHAVRRRKMLPFVVVGRPWLLAGSRSISVLDSSTFSVPPLTVVPLAEPVAALSLDAPQPDSASTAAQAPAANTRHALFFMMVFLSIGAGPWSRPASIACCGRSRTTSCRARPWGRAGCSRCPRSGWRR